MASLLVLYILLAGRYDPLSLQSLYLNAVNETGSALSATGFLVQDDSGDSYLVTNLHVLTGLDFFTGSH